MHCAWKLNTYQHGNEHTFVCRRSAFSEAEAVEGHWPIQTMPRNMGKSLLFPSAPHTPLPCPFHAQGNPLPLENRLPPFKQTPRRHWEHLPLELSSQWPQQWPWGHVVILDFPHSITSHYPCPFIPAFSKVPPNGLVVGSEILGEKILIRSSETTCSLKQI